MTCSLSTTQYGLSTSPLCPDFLCGMVCALGLEASWQCFAWTCALGALTQTAFPMSATCFNSPKSSDIVLQAVDKPDPAERWLLTSQLTQLHECLRPGLTHLNWHALGIQDFVTPIYKVMPMPHVSE